MKAKLLVVDDDARLNALLCDYLKKQGYACEGAPDGASGLSRARKGGYDLLVLDVMLPGKDGFEVLKELRAESQVPVLMLTARAEVPDKVLGLSLGADDYLPKPFEPRELLARVEAVLRRSRAEGGQESLKSGGVSLDPARRRALRGKAELELSTLEFDLLELLLKSRGRVLSRERISEAVKGLDHEATDRSVDVAVSRLREKLGDDARKPRLIKTVRSKGYQWAG